MNKKIHFEEFNYNQIESFQFLQIPRVLLTNEYFKDLSIDSIMLYTLLLDTYKLSTKNGWRDEEGKVYIKFSIKRIEEFLRCGNKKAINLLRELDEEHGIGLIRIKKQPAGKASLIYVNNFNNADLFDDGSLRDYEENDINNLESSVKMTPVSKQHQCQNDTGGSVKMTPEVVSKRHTSNNKYNHTNNSNNEYIDDTPPSIPYKEIITYLNDKTGKTYKHSANKNQSLIKARWNEGNRVEDFKKVIDNKTSEWLADEKMSKYLRPSTLFGNKFDEYRNESKNNKRSYTDNSYKKKGSRPSIESRPHHFDIDKMFERLENIGK